MCSTCYSYTCLTYRLALASFSRISRSKCCSKKSRLGNFDIFSYRTAIAVAYIYIIGITIFFTIGRNWECILLVVFARRIDRSSTVVGAKYIVVRLGSWSVGVRIASACCCSVIGYGNLYRTAGFSITTYILF